MSEGANRMNALNPAEMIATIEEIFASKKELEEVVIRRLISALYFAVFNFWSAKQYSNKKRGKGPNQDNFDFSEFHKDLLKAGLDPEIVTLFQYRVAVDHYIMNPANIRLYNQEIINLLEKRKMRLKIDLKALRRTLESSKAIISYILEDN